MSTWKQVKRIITFELFRNGLTPLVIFVLAVALFVVFSTEPSFDQSIIMDIIFFVLFTGSFTIFGHTESLKPQILGKNIAVSYPVILLQQLPIDTRAIINSRIIIHNVYNIFMQIVFIIPLYAFVPAFQKTMAFPTFILFVLLWMSLGVFASGFAAADDVGKSLNTRGKAALIRLTIQISLAIGFLYVLYDHTPYTLISGSIQIAENWPFLTLLAAILIATNGITYGRKKMKRILRTTDYI